MKPHMLESDVKISYTILTHNEDKTLKKLLEQIYNNKSIWDEIVIVDDYSDNLETITILNEADERNDVRVFRRELKKDFASQKNFANSKCRNEYIFNIDADELFANKLITKLKEIIFINSNVDVFILPRINLVNGITLNHIETWRWKITSLTDYTNIIKKEEIDGDLYRLIKSNKLIIDENDNEISYFIPIINWPDHQYRLYKNNDNIKWINPVHEVISGYKTYSYFPKNQDYAILHYKDISRQEKQNKFYDEIMDEYK